MNDIGWLYKLGIAEPERIELPDGGGAKEGRRYPFGRMAVGDRFVMVLPEQKMAARDTCARVGVRCSQAKAKHGADFTRERKGAVLTYVRVR